MKSSRIRSLDKTYNSQKKYTTTIESAIQPGTLGAIQAF